jgi:hypothetical protein
LLIVEILPCDDILRVQFLVPLELALRVDQACAVARHLAFGLGELDLEGARIDLREQIAFLDHLPFLEEHVHQLAIDPGVHGDGLERRDRADLGEIQVEVAALGSRRGDRYRLLVRRGGLGGLLMIASESRADTVEKEQQHDRSGPEPPAAAHGTDLTAQPYLAGEARGGGAIGVGHGSV